MDWWNFSAGSGVAVIAMTGRRDSTLARHAAIVLDCGVAEEACPHDLAPTSSTTATLALGDALAVALLQRRGFGREDFARLHPGGALGRRLLLRVGDAMVADDVPTLPPQATMRECVVLLAEKRGTAAVVDEQGVLLGVVTSGDLTRLMERDESFFSVPVSEVMTTHAPDHAARRARRRGGRSHGAIGNHGAPGGGRAASCRRHGAPSRSHACWSGLMDMRACFTLMLGATLAACGNESTTPAPVTDVSELPADNIIEGLRHVMTKDGVRTGILNGDTAYMYEVGRRLDLRGVELEFFNESGARSGTLTSESGEYEISTGAFVARGDVVLVTDTPEGRRRLETEELHYDVQGDRLWSDVDFVLNQDGRVTRGTSFTSDARFQTWTVQGARTEGGLPETGTGIRF